MKKALALFTVVLALGMTAAADAEAKRLGGARSSGMQRQQVTQPANTPGTPATPAGTSAAAPTAGAAAAAAPAAAAKRSWMGPLAGLAAGLGLAALASHLGFGQGLANIMMIALMVMAGLALVGFIMRKRAAGAGPALAGAGAGGNAGGTSPNGGRSLLGSGIGSGLGAAAAQPATAGAIPADFDVASFVRNAKSQFVALQTAHDAGDLDQLRGYLTPEMYEAAREDVQSRGGATQQTEVFGLEAQVVEVVEEADRYIVSVRFTGSIRDQFGAAPDDLDELWHLTKPRTGYGGWTVAGIQQVRND